MPFDRKSWDVVLDGIGYRVASDPDGKPLYSSTQITKKGAIIDMQEAEANLDRPTQMLRALVWRSWHRGMGLSKREAPIPGFFHIKLSTLASEYRYQYSFGFDARMPHRVTRSFALNTITSVANSGTVVDFFEIGGNLYSLNGRTVQQINVSTDAVTLSKDLGSGKAGLSAQEFNGKVWLGMGATEEMWSFDGATATTNWVQNSATSIFNDYLTVGMGKLWGGRGNNVRNTSADPSVAANWTAATAVDSSGFAITGLSFFGSHIQIAKTDGLWEMDTSFYAYNLLRWMEHTINANNGNFTGEWEGNILYPNVLGLAAFMHDGRNTQVGPEAIQHNSTPVRGQCTAWTAWGTWLFAAFKNSDGDTYICMGRKSTNEEQSFGMGEIIWHSLNRLTATTVSAMHISLLGTNPRLYFGRGSNIGYYILPRNGMEVVAEDGSLIDANVTFATGGSFYLESHNSSSPSTLKVYHEFNLEATGVTPTDPISIYYRVDGGGWNYLGKIETGPHATLKFPTGVSGYAIEFRLDDSGTSTTSTWVIRGILVTASERPSPIELKTMVLDLTSTARSKAGLQSTRDAPKLKERLLLLSQSLSFVKLEGMFGEKEDVLVQVPVEFSAEKQVGGGENYEVVLLAKVVASIQAPAGPASYYDSGYEYDVGSYYS